jgi:NAD(P)H-hydrate epimerase
MGAAVLSAQACLRTGAGLLTVHIPARGYDIIQTGLPEAMASIDKHLHYFTKLKAEEVDLYDTIGIGPGIGQEKATTEAVAKLLRTAKRVGKPMVLDADALNICSQHKLLLKLLPARAILTPHLKEFERLSAKAKDDFHRLALAQKFTKQYKIFLVLKGAYTATVTPEGHVYFNSTGNPGMATGGSGDVLTGILTSLVAQGYSPLHAALLGVYLHGLAGDLAAETQGQEALIASDIIAAIPAAYQQLHAI